MANRIQIGSKDSRRNRDQCKQAELQPSDQRRLMKVQKIFPGNKLVLWEPSREIHIHRTIKLIHKDQNFITFTFEDGGRKSFFRHDKVLVDR